MEQTYTNDRGYTARVKAIDSGRVLYWSWDANGKLMQRDGCVSEGYFFANWMPVK